MSALRTLFVFLAAMVVHWWWTTRLSFGGFAPQLLLVMTVAAAARRGPVRAMCLGFAWGLFLDVLSANLFGANAFALTLVGYGTGSVRRQIDVAGLAPQVIVVVAMTWAYFLVLGLLGVLFLKSFYWVGWAPFLVDPFYNGVLAAALFVVGGPWADP